MARGSTTGTTSQRETSGKRDTSLRTYRAKRDFTVTAEPAPRRARAGKDAPIFVVQKHQARRAGLHWDFRLEHGGVLWSWAVPKGPSLDPSVKHIAVHVEDHPLGYADFQGTIPDGQYGAGTVETWDRGTWDPLNDPDRGMQNGELTFVLHGQRLNGRFHLVRLRPKPGQRGKADNWLLFKGHDAAERDVADPEAEHTPVNPKQQAGATRMAKAAVPPKQRPEYGAATTTGTATAAPRRPKAPVASIAGVTLTHPGRELWPGVTKQQLAEYWLAVAGHALPGLARRPLAIVRCPEGIAGEHFFQKHARGTLPDGIRSGEASGAPYLAIDDVRGLIAMAQISAIELHAWGATEADPLHPDRLVFDLDPGEGVGFPDVVRAALDVRDRLRQLGLESFCRTTGGKGLHVVVPLDPAAGWDRVTPFCRGFAERLSKEQPDRFLSTVKKIDRRGRILVDWLRNGLGATAVASFCPRARPGAPVATPLAWDEVTRKLDPSVFTLNSVPERLARQRSDPWEGFSRLRQQLPDFPATTPARRNRRGVRASPLAIP
ncbi:MAG TPA: non-homologous end-joining DNA ligase [Acetobacteraceae bacterium]|nr:non-homologous end-joining DNA ligase [Acetobacteraceae bacterium]